jgi:hypothetical protein
MGRRDAILWTGLGIGFGLIFYALLAIGIGGLK